MKSQRNKTIDFTLEQGQEYLENCIKEQNEQEIPTNCTVVGDAFNALKKIKDKSVDLLIVDPPYNLDKDFHGNGFKKCGDLEYAQYTQTWIDAVKPKLKDNASIYVCCDWLSALVIGPLIASNFILRNRITWQREKGRGAKTNWKNSFLHLFVILFYFM